MLDIRLCSAALLVFKERQNPPQNQLKILLKFKAINAQNFWSGQTITTPCSKHELENQSSHELYLDPFAHAGKPEKQLSWV